MIRRRARVGLVAALLVAAAVATATSLLAATQGERSAKTLVTGKVVLSPATPVCRVGTPCSKPLPGVTLVFSRNGRVAARARTDREGRYRTTLAPGTYAVRTTRPGGIGRGLEPRRIRIPRARHVTRNFTYDAGIR